MSSSKLFITFNLTEETFDFWNTVFGSVPEFRKQVILSVRAVTVTKTYGHVSGTKEGFDGSQGWLHIQLWPVKNQRQTAGQEQAEKGGFKKRGVAGILY